MGSDPRFGRHGDGSNGLPGRWWFPHADLRKLCWGARTWLSALGTPRVSWSPDGKFFYLNFRESIYAIPLRPGEMLPPIPAAGFRSKDDVAALPGARLIPEQGAFPGPNPSIYAFIKLATHRNIYRVSVP